MTVQSKDPIASTVIENYRLWSGSQKHNGADPWETRSSTLFDAVAVYLALNQDFVKMERLPIAVTDDGLTVIRPGAKPMNVATEWKNIDGFRDLLVQRLTNGKK